MYSHYYAGPFSFARTLNFKYYTFTCSYFLSPSRLEYRTVILPFLAKAHTMLIAMVLTLLRLLVFFLAFISFNSAVLDAALEVSQTYKKSKQL